MLALILGGNTGPITVPGLITTTSNPFSLAKSQAAFSARVFEIEYHSYKKRGKSQKLENLATKEYELQVDWQKVKMHFQWYGIGRRTAVITNSKGLN